MAGSPGATLWYFFGIVSAFLGFILSVIGLSTPKWTVGKNVDVGLFRFCDNLTSSDKICYDVEDFHYYSGYETVIGAIRALIIIGVLFAGVAVIMAVAYVLIGATYDGWITGLAVMAGIITLLACLFLVIGMGVYGTEIHQELVDKFKKLEDRKIYPSQNFRLGYSIILCMCASFLLLIGGILLFFFESGTPVYPETDWQY